MWVFKYRACQENGTDYASFPTLLQRRRELASAPAKSSPLEKDLGEAKKFRV